MQEPQRVAARESEGILMSEQQPLRVNPVRATDVAIADNPLELVLVFSHVHFLAQPEGLRPEGAPCAAVALPWILAKRLRDGLTRQIEAHEEQMGPIAEPAPPPRQPKPN